MSQSREELTTNNARHMWHPMAHPQAMMVSPPDIIAKGKDCIIWDVDGHKMLDGVGGLWSSNLGHSNQGVRDAVIAQMDELPFYNTFRGTTHVRAIELSTQLVELMKPEGVTAVMFSNGGSDAVEGALEDCPPVLEGPRPGRPHQVCQFAPGLPRCAFWGHVGQRQQQLPPGL
jgi:putrescine aminotransferase